VGVLINFLRYYINQFNEKQYWNTHRALQDEGMAVDNINLEGGKDRPHNMTMGYQDELVCTFDIATIDCVVGRVKVGNWWGIVDQSLRSECAVMHGMWEPEYKSEDKND
jgi:hypothetical protein